MENRPPLLPSPQLLSSPMLPTSKFDYFHQSQQDPEKKSQFVLNNKKMWQLSSDDTCDNARHAYLTPDPSSTFGFSSPPQNTRRPLSSIPILRPKLSGEKITIGRSSIQCTHPIPQQWLNLHISRVHVVIAYKCDSREISVQCRGINPIYVDTTYETHKLKRNDEIRLREGEDFRINIAGYIVIVEASETSTEEIQTSLPSLSPPVTTTTFTEPEKKFQAVDVDSSLGLSSPSPMPEHLQESHAPSQQEQEIRIYHDITDSPSRSSLSPPPEDLPPSEQMSSPHKSLPPTDSALRDALLTTLIFTEVKPTPLPRLVADLTHRMSNVQPELIKSVLAATACVGIVHRSGKDAAGKELSDEYYYIAENDDNMSRRERYYQFARPTRSCRLKHSQYHWRPVKLHTHKSKSAPGSPGKENVSTGPKRKKAKRDHAVDIATKKVEYVEAE